VFLYHRSVCESHFEFAINVQLYSARIGPLRPRCNPNNCCGAEGAYPWYLAWFIIILDIDDDNSSSSSSSSGDGGKADKKPRKKSGIYVYIYRVSLLERDQAEGLGESKGAKPDGKKPGIDCLSLITSGDAAAEQDMLSKLKSILGGKHYLLIFITDFLR